MQKKSALVRKAIVALLVAARSVLQLSCTGTAKKADDRDISGMHLQPQGVGSLEEGVRPGADRDNAARPSS